MFIIDELLGFILLSMYHNQCLINFIKNMVLFINCPAIPVTLIVHPKMLV